MAFSRLSFYGLRFYVPLANLAVRFLETAQFNLGYQAARRLCPAVDLNLEPPE